MLRAVPMAWALLIPFLTGCSNESEDRWSADSHSEVASGLDATEVSSELGLFVRDLGAHEFTFHSWESEETINALLLGMKSKTGGAEIHFAPGRYIIDQGILVDEVDDLTISGSPRVELAFRDGPDQTTSLTVGVNQGTTTLQVEHVERMSPGRRYQIYSADGRGDRLLEFVVKAIFGGVVHLETAAHYMPHVTAIPTGSQIMEELNFFRVLNSSRFTLRGLRMNGIGRGAIHGHTNFGGVFARADYSQHERATVGDMHITNCTFVNLSGRGIAFYGMKGVIIEGNHFANIRAQAVEIDHFSSGSVRNNDIVGAEIGVMINDAYESVVESNVIRDCDHGVRFLLIYSDEWVNTGNVVRNNRIGPGCRAGVLFFNEGMTGNTITGNSFFGLSKAARVINGEGNNVELQ